MHYLGLDCHRAEHSWTLLDTSVGVIDRGAVASRARVSVAKLRRRLFVKRDADTLTATWGPVRSAGRLVMSNVQRDALLSAPRIGVAPS